MSLAGLGWLDEFQSLTRDSNHSNYRLNCASGRKLLFQSLTRDSNHSNKQSFGLGDALKTFQSLTRDSNHSNDIENAAVTYGFKVSIPHAG